MSLHRSYDDWRTASPDERPWRRKPDALEYAWFTFLPEDDNEPEREFRIWFAATSDGEWEITGIDELLHDAFWQVRGPEYDEIHDLALNDQSVISAAMELWL